MKNDLISIIVPIYNTEKYLSKCLDSIINQSYKNIEIILVDDGSLDNSSLICKEYVKKDKRTKYYKKQNGGLSSARNYGLEKASGKYIGFVDSDDVISKDMYETLYNNLVKTNTDMSICEVVRYKDTPKFTNDNNIEIYDTESILKIILEDKKICNYAVNKLYKKELMNDIRYPIGKYQEDVGTTYKYVLKAKKIVYSDSKSYGYYQRNESISNTLNKKFIFDYFGMIERREKDLQGYKIDNYLILNKVNVILGIFIDLSHNQSILKDTEVQELMNKKYRELKIINTKEIRVINTKKHNILISLLLFNRKLFYVLMKWYLKIK